MIALLLAAAVPEAPRAPSGPWNVEAEEDACVLSRQYGSGADLAVVGFQPIFDQSSMFLIVLTGKSKAQSEGTATIERAPDGRKFKGSYVGLNTKTSNRHVTRISVERALFDELDKTTALKIKAGSITQHVQVLRFDRAKPIFKKCEDDLLRGWGVEPANLADDARQPKPKGNILRYFPPHSYPSKARDNGYIGQSTVVLNIGADGAVSKCRVVASAGSLLNDATCERARLIPFQPGTDAAGKATASIYVLRVRWAM